MNSSAAVSKKHEAGRAPFYQLSGPAFWDGCRLAQLPEIRRNEIWQSRISSDIITPTRSKAHLIT